MVLQATDEPIFFRRIVPIARARAIAEASSRGICRLSDSLDDGA